MSDIWIVHSHDEHYINYRVEKGPGARERVIEMILGGHFTGCIDRVDRYNVDEHIADNMSEDIAMALAMRIVESGDPPSDQVRDLIEVELGVGTAIPAAA